MWFDFIAAQTPPEEMGWETNIALVGLWKALKPEHFKPTLPALVEALGYNLCKVGVSHALRTACKPKLLPGEGHWKHPEAPYSLVPLK